MLISPPSLTGKTGKNLMQDYRKQVFRASDDDSREDLEDMLAEVSAGNIPATAQDIRALLDAKRETRERLKNASHVDIVAKQSQVVEAVKNQTLPLRGVLDAYFALYNRYFGKVPFKESILQSLTPEIVEPFSKILKPELIIVPPMKCSEMVESINRYNGSRRKEVKRISSPGLITNWFDRNWDDGATDKIWRIGFAEGIQNVPDNHEISGCNDSRVNEWTKKYAKMGLETINDPSAYLVLMIKSICDNHPVDTHTFTAFDVRSRLTISSSCLKALTGRWAGDHIKFEEVDARYTDNDVSDELRMRAVKWVLKTDLEGKEIK